jgi:hypothetical protein
VSGLIPGSDVPGYDAERAAPPPNQTGTTADSAFAAFVMVAFLAAIVVPSVLTLGTVREATGHKVTGNPTPFGYTVSLLLFFVPIAGLISWFFRCHPATSFRRRAFWLTIGLLVPLGFLLDLIFGNLFFDFPNPEATLQIFAPGYDFAKGAWINDIPIEEFLFYWSGFVAILLVYIFCNEVWVPAYGVADYGDTSRHPPYIINLHWRSAWLGIGALLLAIAYKKFLAPIVPERNYRDGFPLYFTFLLLAAVIPSLLLYRCARLFINWRAVSVTVLWVLLSSLLWEATLASPYGWWHYHYEWMMGLHIKAWADLPIEAVVLWLAVVYTTTIVYETIKVFLHMKKPLRDVLFGPRAVRAAEAKAG